VIRTNLSGYAASARRLDAMVNDQTKFHGAHGCDRPPLVDVPTLSRADVRVLGVALTLAAGKSGPLGSGWFPRIIPVNDRMKLMATYPWMVR
jgi:hypothetical protein